MTSEPETALPPSTAPKNNRGILYGAGGLAVFWIAGLVVLVLTSANPITLNQKQILRSDFVVTATRKSTDSNLLHITKEWKHGEALGDVPVANFDQARFPAGQEFLVPLERLGMESFRITETNLPNAAPLIYPATAEAKAQLETLLTPPQR